MTYGRQMTLNSTTSYVLPQMVDDEYLTTNPIEPDSQQPEGILPKVGFFVFAIKLSETTVELASYVAFCTVQFLLLIFWIPSVNYTRTQGFPIECAEVTIAGSWSLILS